MLPTRYIHLYLAILRAIKVPTMPSTFSNDPDFMRPTQYVAPSEGKSQNTYTKAMETYPLRCTSY